LDPTLTYKNYGFVLPDPISVTDDEGEPDPDTGERPKKVLEIKPIKIWGVKNLNRCFHMDKVYVKFVDWVEWGTAGSKLIENVNFRDFEEYVDFGNRKLLVEF
jgi:hypothetical protein